MKVICEGTLPFELLFGIPLVIIVWACAIYAVAIVVRGILDK